MKTHVNVATLRQQATTAFSRQRAGERNKQERQRRQQQKRRERQDAQDLKAAAKLTGNFEGLFHQSLKDGHVDQLHDDQFKYKVYLVTGLAYSDFIDEQVPGAGSPSEYQSPESRRLLFGVLLAKPQYRGLFVWASQNGVKLTLEHLDLHKQEPNGWAITCWL